MFDKSSIEENVDGLVRQIKLALMEDVDVTDVTLQEMPDSPEFSIEDLRGELDRLKTEQASYDTAEMTTSSEDGSGQALVPAAVPEIPPGVFVIPSMNDLLSKLLDDQFSRIGFLVSSIHTTLVVVRGSFRWCKRVYSQNVVPQGMGGIGKTVAASWLVRQSSVREHFSKILW
jgi:hypothetical protein